MKSIDVDPQDLRFTQASVGATFQVTPNSRRLGGGDTIRGAVHRIRSNTLSPHEFPRLKVVSHNGILWSLDNRRLWVFRKAQVPRITVNLVPSVKRNFRWLRALKPGMYRGMTNQAYYPRVRIELEGQSEGGLEEEDGQEDLLVEQSFGDLLNTTSPDLGGHETQDSGFDRGLEDREKDVVAEPRRSGRVTTRPDILDPSVYWTTSDWKKTTRKDLGRRTSRKKT